MNPQVETKKLVIEVPTHKPRERLIGAAFVESVSFAGETTSVRVPGNCDGIAPARLEPDGAMAIIAAGQRADGVKVWRKVQDRVTGQKYVEQHFIPWSNIRGLSYGE